MHPSLEQESVKMAMLLMSLPKREERVRKSEVSVVLAYEDTPIGWRGWLETITGAKSFFSYS
jgi:hypothetical protein